MDGGAWCPWGHRESDTTERLLSLSTVSAPCHYFGSNDLKPYSTTPKFLVGTLRSAYCLWSYVEQGPSWGPKIEQTLPAALRPSLPRGEESPVGCGPPPLRTAHYKF